MDCKITVNTQVEYEDLQAIMTTAWEGGSDYWMDNYDIAFDRDKDTTNITELVFKATLDDTCPYPTTWHIIADHIARAIDKLFERPGYEQAKQDIINNLDELGAVDAETADVLVQLAVFGEVTYG